MGFNKKILPDFDKLIEEYNRRGHDEFRRIYLKYDAFFGLDDQKKKFMDQVMLDDILWVEPQDIWYKRFFTNLLKPFQSNWYNKKV